jgi:uncharacterized protein YegL
VNELAHPLYLVLDVSFSTTDRIGDTTGIEQTNALVRGLLDRLAAQPAIAARVWMSVIDFADEACVQVPLTPAGRLVGARPPTLEARGGTSYAQAFELACDRIATDLAQLRADGTEVASPLVVFLTDGDPVEPDRDWQAAFAALVALDHGTAPRIWPIGYGAANPILLGRLVSPPGWTTAHVIDIVDGPSRLPETVLDVLCRAEPFAGRRIDGGPFVAADPDDLAWNELDAGDATTPGDTGGKGHSP